MTTFRILEEIGAKLSAALAHTPVQDLEKNVKALFLSAFSKMDLVTREEFEIQRAILRQMQSKLTELETRIAHLEAERTQTNYK